MHVTTLEKLDTTKKEIVDCDRLIPRAQWALKFMTQTKRNTMEQKSTKTKQIPCASPC